MKQWYILYNSIDITLNIRFQIFQNDMFKSTEFCNLRLITIPEILTYFTLYKYINIHIFLFHDNLHDMMPIYCVFWSTSPCISYFGL